MSLGELTKRDKEHMISIFLLEGHEKPVGPSELATNMEVSRAGALQKMKRLEELGVGDYIPEKGLKLNQEGVSIVEEDIFRHHVIEQFFQETLGLEFEEACKEAEKLGGEMSERMVELIRENCEEDMRCKCGSCLDPPYEPSDLDGCHWLRKKYSLIDKKEAV